RKPPDPYCARACGSIRGATRARRAGTSPKQAGSRLGRGGRVLEALTRTTHIERDRPRVENPSIGRSRGCRKGPVKVAYEGFETMSRVPSLSSPFLLGFDEIERVLDRVAKGADGYPPYNIERLARDP